jgi:hypothetical protein
LTGEKLERDYFGLHRIEWDDPNDGIEFNLTISDWFKLFRSTGFQVVDYLEPRPPEGENEKMFFTDRSWSRRFPCEQVWKLRKPLE